MPDDRLPLNVGGWRGGHGPVSSSGSCVEWRGGVRPASVHKPASAMHPLPDGTQHNGRRSGVLGIVGRVE